MDLNKTCTVDISTRDAVHVPVVVGRLFHPKPTKDDSGKMIFAPLPNVEPGQWVKFIDSDFTDFTPCSKEEAHGMINPFIDYVPYYGAVVIILKPGITSPVRHNFDIDPAKADARKQYLEFELAQARKEDPGCADCWVIENDEVIRT